jgi:hypothetical protein
VKSERGERLGRKVKGEGKKGRQRRREAKEKAWKKGRSSFCFRLFYFFAAASSFLLGEAGFKIALKKIC